MNRKFDWKVIEQQYITGDMSLRELARMNGIANHSLVMGQSTRNEWNRKRIDFRSQRLDKTITYMADDEAKRVAKEVRVRDNAIEAIDEAISVMRDQMKMTRQVMRNGEYVEEPMIIVRAQDVALLIDRLNVLFGRPSTISEERSLGVSLSAGGTLGPDILRGIVEATRGISDPEGAARSPIPRSRRAGAN
jgi:hypothetical protein